MCDICGTKLFGQNAVRECNYKGHLTGRFICRDCSKCYKCNGKIYGNLCREYDNQGIWTNKYICGKCNIKFQRYGTFDDDKIKKIKDDYKIIKKDSYYYENKCVLCGGELKSGIFGHPVRKYDEKGNWTGELFCHKCGKKDWNKIYRLSDRRINQLNQNSNQAFGDLGEELTVRWRKVKNLNVENDNYTRTPIDHSPDTELGTIQNKDFSFKF